MFPIPYPKRRGTLHDQVFKDLLGELLPDFVTLVAPEHAGRFDFSRWELLNKETFTDWPKGKRREVDLLAAVPRTGGGPIALVHVEVEARYRAEIDRRVAGYYMQIRLRHDRPVLPIVLSLRGGPPGITVRTVVEADRGMEIDRFRYYLFSLQGSRAEDYLACDQPLAWALAALMRPESLSRAEHKMACLQRIASSRVRGLRRFLLVNCVETYLQLEGRDAEELRALQARSEEVRAMGGRRLTWAEQFEEKGWHKGVEKGIEVGVEMGMEKGARQTLLRLLAFRFGPLPDEVKERVEAIHSVERLNELADQILVARSLEEMGLQ
jgi:hypothetical protein